MVQENKYFFAGDVINTLRKVAVHFSSIIHKREMTLTRV